MKLTFIKNQEAAMCSIGVLPCVNDNGLPGERIEDVVSCSVESIAGEYSRMKLEVIIKENKKSV